MKSFLELLGTLAALLLKTLAGIVAVAVLLVVNMVFAGLVGAFAGWLLDLIFSYPLTGLFKLIGCPSGGFWLLGAVFGLISGLFKFHIRFNRIHKKQA